MRVTITPEKAQELLALNTNNRNLSKALAKKYASDMVDGLWKYNGDPIRVSESGILLDGQHRLQACVSAQVPFEAELIEGLPEDVRPTIDTGRKRSAADTLNIITGSNKSNGAVAASARQILNYVCGFHPSQQQSTPAIVRLIAKHPDIVESCRLASRCNGILTPGPLGAVLFIGTRQPGFDKRAMAFVDAVHSGADMQKGDPRLAIREAFINKRMGPGVGRLPEMTWCVIAVIRAWNAWATGQELAKIMVMRDGAGQWNVPDIIGGPGRGLGVDSLVSVRLSPTARQARARLEEETGQLSA